MRKNRYKQRHEQGGGNKEPERSGAGGDYADQGGRDTPSQYKYQDDAGYHIVSIGTTGLLFASLKLPG